MSVNVPYLLYFLPKTVSGFLQITWPGLHNDRVGMQNWVDLVVEPAPLTTIHA